MQNKERVKDNRWDMKTVLIILFIIVLIYFYLQNNSVQSVIESVNQSGGTIKNLENISRILQKF